MAKGKDADLLKLLEEDDASYEDAESVDVEKARQAVQDAMAGDKSGLAEQTLLDVLLSGSERGKIEAAKKIIEMGKGSHVDAERFKRDENADVVFYKALKDLLDDKVTTRTINATVSGASSVPA